MSFYKLGIKGDMVYALEMMGIEAPSPIQTLAIPQILKGHDLLAEAQTGTGKTLAFLLPLFQSINHDLDAIQCLIIAPTRELALQITQVATDLAQFLPLGILACYGGQDVNAQLHKLKEKIHVVVGTPGRVLDHIKRGSLNLNHLKALVVDEADQLFHIGFKEEMKAIIKALPKEKQTLCFSATLSHRVDSFVKHYLKDPCHVKAPAKKITLDAISQCVLETSNRKKLDHFLKLVATEKPKKAIIFCRSRVGAQSLYEDLLSKGLSVETLHGALTQAKREFVMEAFKNNQVKYLVATDVAARGLDVEGVSHVFNYNLPDEAETYVHRIGRTGRAGNIGASFIIMTLKDEARLKAVEAFIGQTLKRIRYEDPLEQKPQMLQKKKKAPYHKRPK